MISGTESKWRPPTRNVPQGSGLGPVQILDDGAGDTELGTMADMPQGHAVTQRDLNRLKKWPTETSCNFTRGSKKFRTSEGNNPRHKVIQRATQQESSFAERDLGILMDAKLGMSQQCASAPMKSKSILGCSR